MTELLTKSGVRLRAVAQRGAEDRIVSQDLCDANAFRGVNVIRQTIAGGGHFPWIERPQAVRDAFADLTVSILAGTLGG